ncbi:MAG: hypothetical protein AAF447_00525 [Myxococcota bacterium]
MYRCELCNVVQPPRTPVVKVTTESRPTEYPSRPKANRLRIGRKMKSFDDPGGAGYEIAKEADACPACAAEFEAKQAEREAAGVFDDAQPAAV